MMIRRSRLKFKGFAYHPNLTYKLELGFSNRDISGGSNYTSNSPRIIIDASVRWKFNKNLWIQFGQAKLPGNIERIISSGLPRTLQTAKHIAERRNLEIESFPSLERDVLRLSLGLGESYEIMHTNDEIAEILNETKETIEINWSNGMKRLRDISQKEKTDKFIALFEGEISSKTSNFLKTLGEANRLRLYDNIFYNFLDLVAKKRNQKNVTVSSAFELEESQLDKIKSAMQKRLDAEIVISASIDTSLIGGMKISYEDQVIDLSLKNKLESLKSQLRN